MYVYKKGSLTGRATLARFISLSTGAPVHASSSFDSQKLARVRYTRACVKNACCFFRSLTFSVARSLSLSLSLSIRLPNAARAHMRAYACTIHTNARVRSFGRGVLSFSGFLHFGNVRAAGVDDLRRACAAAARPNIRAVRRRRLEALFFNLRSYVCTCVEASECNEQNSGCEPRLLYSGFATRFVLGRSQLGLLARDTQPAPARCIWHDVHWQRKCFSYSIKVRENKFSFLDNIYRCNTLFIYEKWDLLLVSYTQI